MSWILIVSFYTHGLFTGYSVSEMKTKTACETAANELRKRSTFGFRSANCIEVMGEVKK